MDISRNSQQKDIIFQLNQLQNNLALHCVKQNTLQERIKQMNNERASRQSQAAAFDNIQMQQQKEIDLKDLDEDKEMLSTKQQQKLIGLKDAAAMLKQMANDYWINASQQQKINTNFNQYGVSANINGLNEALKEIGRAEQQNAQYKQKLLAQQKDIWQQLLEQDVQLDDL